jgi:hypothetical protein
MAWMASWILVEGASEDALIAALGQLANDAEQQADCHGLEGAPTPITVTPEVDGWRAILGLRGYIADLSWAAARLSEVATRALSLELIGNSLLLRMTEQREGQQQSTVQSPNLPWNAITTHDGPMPLYGDVEQRAYVTLRALGVPQLLIATGFSPVGSTQKSLGEGALLQLSHEEAEGTLERDTVKSGPRPRVVGLELSAGAVAADVAPVLPREVGYDFGLLLVDERYVEGKPHGAAVDRLISLEQALLERAKAACPDQPQIDVSITYHAGSHQLLLDEMLRARGRHVAPTVERHSIPWWQFWRHFGKFS